MKFFSAQTKKEKTKKDLLVAACMWVIVGGVMVVMANVLAAMLF